MMNFKPATPEQKIRTRRIMAEMQVIIDRMDARRRAMNARAHRTMKQKARSV